MFNHIMGTEKDSDIEKKIKRIAIRAIIVKGNKILMVTNNKGDIKFPGGGINNGENHHEAMIREVAEETGYKVSCVKEKVGLVVERRKDQFEEDAIFEMESHYYIGELTGEVVEQTLDVYEEELEFKPKWIEIKDAIKTNQLVVNNSDRNPWVDRELFVLNQLSSNLKIIKK